MSSEIQYIGADLGRGYVKGYTEFEGKSYDCIFKSVVGDGRVLHDFSIYPEPIFLKIEDEDVFAGELSEKESSDKRYNFSDDKTSKTAKQLLYTLLSKLAKTASVKIVLGVPNKEFSNEAMNKVQKAYKHKTIEILDNITNVVKRVYIQDIIIYRESDAALLQTLSIHKDRIALNNRKIGMITLGFKTCELTFFDKNQKFNDKFSKTIEKGNRTVLDIISGVLDKQGITKALSEIDTETDYDSWKKPLYANLIEGIDQNIQMEWVNFREMTLFLGGGTSLNLDKKNIPEKFELVQDPQTCTSKGLFLVAKVLLK